MYKLHKNQYGVDVCIENIEDKIFIPLSDPANTDYQAYLKWVAEGNTPLPADEVQA